MGKILKTAFQFLFQLLLLVEIKAQNSDCIVLDSSQKKLYLNGNNFTLIDNGLHCFKLSSIGGEKDSIVRIWLLQSGYPDTPLRWRVKMFEFGKNGDIPFAKLHILEWGIDSDKSLSVTCIKNEKFCPNKGWLAFEKDIRRLDLPELYKRPLFNHFAYIDFGMLIIQFMFGRTTYTVDFTGLVNLSDPINALQLNHSKRINYLLLFINKHFSTNLSLDYKAHDFSK